MNAMLSGALASGTDPEGYLIDADMGPITPGSICENFAGPMRLVSWRELRYVVD